jgi:sugar phosphate isomerase/epimerase
MKFFIASSLCWAYHPEEVIILAKERGFYGVEMWAEHIFYHHADPELIRLTADKHSIALTLHASSWDLNICSFNQGIQQQSVHELEKSIDLASRLGVWHMTFHPGRFTVKDYFLKDHMDALIRNMKRLIEYARVRQVTISMELMEPIVKEILTDPQAMNQFQENIGEDLQVTLDIAHVPLVQSSLEYLKQLRNVNSIHLSDSSQTAYHVPLGAGDIDIENVLIGLSKVNLPIILEGMETTKRLSFLNRHYLFLCQNGWMERKV